jgi:hypothetical protein
MKQSPKPNARSGEAQPEVYGTYCNRHGERVSVRVSLHARARFYHRWMSLHPTWEIAEQLDEVLLLYFQQARRIEHLQGQYAVRRRKYGKDTIFFWSRPFVFVVKDASIITVELATGDTRHLNKATPDERADAGSKGLEEAPVDTRALDARLKARWVLEPEKRAAGAANATGDFQLLGLCLDRNGEPRATSLGDYPAPKDGASLRDDPAFQKELAWRMAAKSPSRVYAVYAKRHGEQVCIFDQLGPVPSDSSETGAQESMEEALEKQEG